MSEKTSEEKVLLSINNNESFELLSSTMFSDCKDGVPYVGLKFYVITMSQTEFTATREYGPSVKVTEVLHDKFRDIIPPEVKGMFAHLLDKEGYFVKAETFDPE